MTDELIERICAEHLAEMAGRTPRVILKIAFATLKPHEQIQEWLWTTDADPWALEAKIRRRAKEEMREQIEKDVLDVFQSQRFVAEGPQAVLMAIRNCALPVEPDNE